MTTGGGAPNDSDRWPVGVCEWVAAIDRKHTDDQSKDNGKTGAGTAVMAIQGSPPPLKEKSQRVSSLLLSLCTHTHTRVGLIDTNLLWGFFELASSSFELYILFFFYPACVVFPFGWHQES